MLGAAEGQKQTGNFRQMSVEDGWPLRQIGLLPYKQLDVYCYGILEGNKARNV
jgi:hypothetical protein